MHKLTLLVATALLLGLCSAAPSPWMAPNSFQVKGLYQLPYFNITEPFVFSYDANSNRMKWDYFHGMDVTIYHFDENNTWTLGPQINKMICTGPYNSQYGDFSELTSIFPDLSTWSYLRSEKVRGISSDVWTFTDAHGGKYYFSVDKNFGTPVQLSMFGLNYLMGSHQDIYIFDFIDYIANYNNASEYTPPSICGSSKPENQKAERKHRQALTEGIKNFHHNIASTEFQDLTAKHERNYASEEEKRNRLNIYKDNKKFIQKHNADQTKTFQMKMNHWFDLTHEEWRSRTKCARPSLGVSKGSIPETFTRTGVLPGESTPPSSIDWVQKGAVTMVKDQASCGSCWTFGSTGTLEGHWAIKTGKLIRLSEQQIVDCAVTSQSQGCGGGEAEDALSWVMMNGGIATELSYPYLGQNGFCKANNTNSGVTVIGYVNVTSGDENALKAAVAIGPVTIAIDASHPTFRFYHTGIYYEPACGNQVNQLDHEVLAVGYGTIAGMGDYWLVKNSWTTMWGDDGFIKMSRNRGNNCGISTDANYPLM